VTPLSASEKSEDFPAMFFKTADLPLPLRKCSGTEFYKKASWDHFRRSADLTPFCNIYVQRIFTETIVKHRTYCSRKLIVLR
jgi:hypothetical protein